ncbi:MAG: DUF1549 and DUF1553 domain-containing protein [Pirellulaceae bacterium]|nr:DUF1549 and DUF1553 domain-containing protein [Pirellulaceae bacterium]
MLKRQSVSALALAGIFFLSCQISFAQPNNGAVKKKAPAKPRANEIKTKLPHQETPLALPFVMDKVDANQLGKMQLASIRIDKTIDKKLASEGVTPNSPTSDGQFVRRAYLDITGTIPTGREAYLFITSKQSNKRAVLIDYLLGQPGYASHMYNYWADTLRIVDRSTGNTYIRPWADWIKESLRDNIPYDKFVREMLSAEGKVWHSPATGYKLRDIGMPLDNLNNTTRIFLGTRIGCAQCHDHPFDKWTQKEFYQLAAFESGLRTSGARATYAQKNMKAAITEVGERSREANLMRRIERFNRYTVNNTAARLKFPHDYAYDDAKPGQLVTAKVLFGSIPTMAPESDRRDLFAHWMTSHDNPRFAMTIANRMWKRAFGRGVFEPVDDIMDDTHISNPELLGVLVQEMRRVKFDIKEFMRIIYNTQAYQRQVTYDDVNAIDDYFFEGPVLRRMTAEQIWDSVLTLTFSNIDHYLRPDDKEYLKAIDADPGLSIFEINLKIDDISKAESNKNAYNRKHSYQGVVLRRASELPQPLPAAHFLRQFGQSDREIIGDGTVEGTVPQLLALFNGPITHMMLESGSVVHREVMGTNEANRLTVVFLSILGRMPTEDERAASYKEVKDYGPAGLGNVIWALLNTREFIYVQ